MEHSEVRCLSCESRVAVESLMPGDCLECSSCGARMEVQNGPTLAVKLLAWPFREERYELLGSIGEIPIDSSKVYRVGNRDIAVFRTPQQFYALKNQCPHHGFDLSGGQVENGQVRCSGHGFRFDLLSGVCDRNPGLVASTYDLKIEGGELFVRLS